MTDTPDTRKVLGWLHTQRRHYHGYPEVRGAYTDAIDCIHALLATVEAGDTRLTEARRAYYAAGWDALERALGSSPVGADATPAQSVDVHDVIAAARATEGDSDG